MRDPVCGLLSVHLNACLSLSSDHMGPGFHMQRAARSGAAMDAMSCHLDSALPIA